MSACLITGDVAAAAAAAKLIQSCPTLCDPIDISPLGSAIPGILTDHLVKAIPARFLHCKVTSFSLSMLYLLAVNH